MAALDIVNGIEMFFFPSAWFFKLVPGVPETGPYNMHLVMDGGTFFLAVGETLLIIGALELLWRWAAEKWAPQIYARYPSLIFNPAT